MPLISGEKETTDVAIDDGLPRVVNALAYVEAEPRRRMLLRRAGGTEIFIKGCLAAYFCCCRVRVVVVGVGLCHDL